MLGEVVSRNLNSRTASGSRDSVQGRDLIELERSSTTISTHGKRRPANEEEEFKWRFGYSNPDCTILGHYNCALMGKIILQGKMWVTSTAVGFYSVFNDTNFISLIPTLVVFEYEEVASMHKRSNAIFFHNSIEIELKDGSSYFFTSYVNREKAWALLMMLTGGRFGEYDASLLTSRARVYQKGSIADRAERTPTAHAFKNEFVPVPHQVIGCYSATYPDAELEPKLDVCLPMAIYNMCLADLFPHFVSPDGGESTFDQIMHALSSDVDVKIGRWQPKAEELPTFKAGLMASRTCSWDRVIDTKVPLWNSQLHAHVTEFAEIFVNSDATQLTRRSFIDSAGMAYADCIRLHCRLIFTQINERTTQLDADLQIQWLKSTLLKSVLRQTIQGEWVNTQTLTKQALTQTLCSEGSSTSQCEGDSPSRFGRQPRVVTIDINKGTADVRPLPREGKL